MYVALCALLPLVGGLASAFISFKNEKKRNAFIEALTVLTSVCVLLALVYGREDRVRLFSLNARFVCALGTDGMSRIYAGLAAFLWPLCTLYAFEYMKTETHTGQFYMFYTMAYGVTLLICASANLFTLYIFYECLTIITLPLVEHEQNKEAYRAGRAYLVYLIGGAFLGFAAMVIAGVQGGTEFVRGGSISADADAKLVRAAYIMAFIGFGAKAAVFPLSRWLPKASVAPTPVTALLHAAAVVNAGVFSVTRCGYYVFVAELLRGSWAQYTAMCLASATVVYGAVRAVRETQLKRRLAWSTVSNLGYMLFAASLLTSSGMHAALTHMLYHSLMKIVLFFCAGAIMCKTGKTDIHEMRGLSRRMPFTCAAFALAGLALTGLPPLVGFTSKYLIVTAALENAGAFETAGAVSLIISAILTAVYIFTFLVPAYFMPARSDEPGALKTDMGACMKTSILILSAAIICASLSGTALSAFIGGI